MKKTAFDLTQLMSEISDADWERTPESVKWLIRRIRTGGRKGLAADWLNQEMAIAKAQHDLACGLNKLG